MTPTLARRERQHLCDLALELGPAAATGCGDWTAVELMAHLFVREHRPLGALGIALPGLGALTEASMARAIRTPYARLVAKVREPGLTPYALRPVEVLANTLEYVVHHEDLRRALPGWEPRSLDAADLDALWRAITMTGRLLVRPAGVPVTIRRADTGASAVLRRGEDPVVVSGAVLELVLFLFGRSATRGIDLAGPDTSVARLRGADLGL